MKKQRQGMEKCIPTNTNQKVAKVALLISSKIHFKTKNIKDRENGYMDKSLIYCKSITFLNQP